MAQDIQTYQDFWAYYLRQRRRAEVRGLHYFGTGFAILMIAKGIFDPDGLHPLIYVVFAVVSLLAYGSLSIAIFQRELPSLLRYPLWTLRSDFRLMYLFITGGLQDEYQRLELL